MALNDIAFPDGVTQAPRWDKCIHEGLLSYTYFLKMKTGNIQEIIQAWDNIEKTIECHFWVLNERQKQNKYLAI